MNENEPPEIGAPNWTRKGECRDGKPDEATQVTRKDLYDAIASGKPIRISCAVLSEGAVFRHGHIPRELRLENCEVRGPFVLENVTCDESLVLSGTVFKGGLNLNGVQIKGSLQTNDIRCEALTYENGSRIPGKADFQGISIEGQWNSNNAAFLDGFDVQYGSFRGPVLLQSCIFKGEEAASFGLANFHQLVDLQQARFGKAGATFIAASLENHLLLDRVRSSGPLSFSLCKIQGALGTSYCRFRQGLNFANAVISGFWLLSKTVCHGSLDCANLSAGQVKIEGCRFAGEVLFASASMRRFSLLDSTLQDSAPLNLYSAQIEGELEMNGCRLGADLNLSATRLGSLSLGDWNRRRVAGIDDADVWFYRDVDMTGIQVRGKFSCCGALLAGKCLLSEMRIDGEADVVFCRFGLPEDGEQIRKLSGHAPSRVDKLLIRQRQLIKDDEEAAVFNRTQYGGRVGFHAVFHRPAHFQGIRCQGAIRFLNGCKFQKAAEFYFATFADEANFGGATFEDVLSLKNAKFERALKFDLLRPAVRTHFAADSRIEMQDCTYESLQEFPRWKSHPQSEGRRTDSDLARLLPHIQGDRSTFIQLEQYYRRTGNAEWADEVRWFWRKSEGDGKQWWSREKQRIEAPGLFVRWLWDRLLRWSTGYGTRVAPLVAFLLLIGLVDLVLQIRYSVLKVYDKDISSSSFSALVHVVHLASAALIAVGAAVLGDTFRRGIWPEKS